MDHEFLFTLHEYGDQEFRLRAPSLIAAMMRVMSRDSTEPRHVLRAKAFDIISENEYKWLNKP